MMGLSQILQVNNDPDYMIRPLSKEVKTKKRVSKKFWDIRKWIQHEAKNIGVAITCMVLAFTAGLHTSQVQAYQVEHNQIVLTFEECISLFQDYYSNYPGYHYENRSGTVSIDFVVPNPEEEAYQYCMFFFEGY